MKILVPLLLFGSLLLTACSSANTPMDMNHSGMMHGGGMMGETESAGFLPGQGQDIASFPEAKPSETIDIDDGDTIRLDPTLVRKNIGGHEIAMYGYNGQIPGPLLKVTQGSTFTVNVTNRMDLPTSIHWHGLRLENANDGAVGVTQEAIEPGESFTYTITVPDEGMFWYHPHVREDLQQDMGLAGNLWVTPKDTTAYSSVNREEVLILDDILLEGGLPVPYGKTEADHTLMGRFGNTMLINGKTDYDLSIPHGSVVRFYLTNAANTRTFRVHFDGAIMKLVGSDAGRAMSTEWVDDVTIAPSERAIVDVLFTAEGVFPASKNVYTIMHEAGGRSYALGTIRLTQEPSDPALYEDFVEPTYHDDVSEEIIGGYLRSLDKPIDHTLVLDMGMMGGMGGRGMMMGEAPEDGIEWEDSAMNMMPMGNMMQWKLVDEETGAANDKLMYTAKVGDRMKIRIVNRADSPHPMQHPIHFHGQRFLVLSDNGKETENFVWKDTVLVPAGHTVDILLDISNPGDWMFHCHIAEHLSSGMMGMLNVLP